MKISAVVIRCLLAGFAVPVPAQELRIATVNVARVLDEFPSFQEEVRKQKEEREKFGKDQQEKSEGVARSKQMIRHWEELRTQVDDKNLSKAERQKADHAAKALVKEIKELELLLLSQRGGRDWGTPEQRFNDDLDRRRKLMLDEVQRAVAAVSSREPFDVVFDISLSHDGTSSGMVRVNPTGIPDLSPAVLAELKRREGVKQMYAAVNGAEFFSVGGAGELGQPSAAETAFRDLLKTPDAVEQCRSLLEKGQPVGRLFGFLGLKLLNAKGWPLHEAQIRRDRNTVRIMSGRRKSESFVSEIAKQIGQGKLK